MKHKKLFIKGAIFNQAVDELLPRITLSNFAWLTSTCRKKSRCPSVVLNGLISLMRKVHDEELLRELDADKLDRLINGLEERDGKLSA